MSDQDSGQQRSDRHDEAEEMARLQEQINNLPVGEHILYMMHSLSALAVDRLGLAPEAAERRDMEQARLAIDAFKALLRVLEEARPTEEIGAHRGILSQLQLAYAGELGRAGGTKQAGGAPSEDVPESAAEGPGEVTTETPGETPGEAPGEAPTKKPATKKPATKKPATKKPSKPRSSTGGAAKKSGGAGTAKSAKKTSGGSGGKSGEKDQ